jgi:hypothetical protein
LRSDLFGFVGRQTVAATTSSSSVSSSSEVNFLDNINPVESKGDLAKLLDEISYKHNFEDVSDLPCQNGGSKEDFADLHDSVSYGFEDEWMSDLELWDDDPTIFTLELNNSSTT